MSIETDTPTAETSAAKASAAESSATESSAPESSAPDSSAPDSSATGSSVPGSSPRRSDRASVPLSTVVVGLAMIAVTIAACIFGYLWLTKKNQLDEVNAAAANDRRAEQVAMDYALGASTIDVKDFPAWITRLKANTGSALAAKFDASAPELEQILLPLRWTSTAQPIAAKVMSVNDGIYQVNAFLDVRSTSAQSPEGAQTTVNYHVTVDKNAGWKVTDVGGMDGALPVN